MDEIYFILNRTTRMYINLNQAIWKDKADFRFRTFACGFCSRIHHPPFVVRHAD